jgi:hypothetical protein
MSDFETLKQEWATKYRVPVTSSMFSSTYYVATLTVPADGADDGLPWKTEMPTEEDAALLSKYIEYRVNSWYGRPTMDDRELDIDPGVNTTHFMKSSVGWHYSHQSWRSGPMFIPTIQAEKQFPTLLAIIDHERTFGGEPSVPWTRFKEENGIV